MCESLGDEGQDTIGKDIKQSVPLPAEAPQLTRSPIVPSPLWENKAHNQETL